MPAKIAIATGSGIIYSLNRIGIKNGPCSCLCCPRHSGRKRIYLTRGAVHDFRRDLSIDVSGSPCHNYNPNIPSTGVSQGAQLSAPVAVNLPLGERRVVESKTMGITGNKTTCSK